MEASSAPSDRLRHRGGGGAHDAAIGARRDRSPPPLLTATTPAGAITRNEDMSPPSGSRPPLLPVRTVLAASLVAAGFCCFLMTSLFAKAHGGGGGGAAGATGEVRGGPAATDERRRASASAAAANETTTITADGSDDLAESRPVLQSVGFYVVSLDGVNGSDPINNGRLDAFLSSWWVACGKHHSINFDVCPGTVHPKRGFGITRSFKECFDRSISAGHSISYFFEDDARLFDDSSFCDPAHREKLHRTLPTDLYLLLLGGHGWITPNQKENEHWDEGFVKIQRSFGAFGFAVPRHSIKHLRDFFAKYLEESDRDFLAQDTEWFKRRDRSKAIYASNPLIVKHGRGYSNTWKMDREEELGENPRPFSITGNDLDRRVARGGGKKGKWNLSINHRSQKPKEG